MLRMSFLRYSLHNRAAIGRTAPMAEAPHSRHSRLVRVTHWLITFAFLALLVSGLEIVVSHPRFYWGEAGNVLTPPLFALPIPASRSSVPTGYGFWCNAWPTNPAWRFVAVGIGHDVDYWTEFLRALAEVDPDMAVNIEHEDADYGRLEGLALAAENLRAAAAKM